MTISIAQVVLTFVALGMSLITVFGLLWDIHRLSVANMRLMEELTEAQVRLRRCEQILGAEVL